MLKRTKRQAAKPAAKKKVSKKPVAKTADKNKKTDAQQKKAAAFNEKAQWKAFKDLKAKVNKKLAKLKKDFKKNENPQILLDDINILSLLGGECNYMLSQLETADVGTGTKKASKKAAKKAVKKAPVKKAAKKAVKKGAKRKVSAKK